ncbi:protein STPG4 [Megalops cyprinoides]|uniref:protein STPG4 n=1 Tax=Megalops cyprinoides TaxID=118141 RepID=UPI001863CA22|nr:protein STPG4 [Megalops cyprinoides]
MSVGQDKDTTKSKEKAIDLDGARGKGIKKKDQSERDSWWKGSLTDSPNPGSYHIRSFIEEAELNPVRRTYGFQGTGRKVPLWWVRKGDLLLPGAYSYTDSIQEALQRQASYSFKNCPRPQNFTLGVRDKDVNISPCHYDLTEKPVPKSPCKHVMFRSAVQRHTFLPREGPAPGQYDIKPDNARAVTSCFRSTVPRLHRVRSRTPGPGTYDPFWKMGQHSGTEASLSRAYGLFFRNIF